MIVGSLLLILVAVVLLVAGLVGGSSILLVASIATSLLAAVALVVGARQAAAARVTTEPMAGPRAADRWREPVVDRREPPDDHLWRSPADRHRQPPVDQDDERRWPADRDREQQSPADRDDQHRSPADRDREYGPTDLEWPPTPVATTTVTEARPQTEPATVPVQFVPSTVGTDESGWRQPSEPSVTAREPAPPADPDRYAGAPTSESGPAFPDPYRDRSADAGEAHREPLTGGASDMPPPDPDPLTDEPGVEEVAPADAARVARLDSEVVVVDGRPRYHLTDCLHLLGRAPEPLPVSEAVELGFTPCATCAPDASLLAATSRPY